MAGVLEKGKQHILVTGSHRSGTTWVGKTISLPPEVRYIHEPFNVTSPNPDFGVVLKKWFSYMPESPDEEGVKKSFESVLTMSSFRYAIANKNEGGIGLATSPLTYVNHFIADLKIERLLIKDPLALFSAGWLYEKFGLKVICMVRHPLAFAGSLKVVGWTFDFHDFLEQPNLMANVLSPFRDEMERFVRNPGDVIDQAALLWKILHYVILTYQEKYPDWLFLKHEDLATNPVDGFRLIFSFLDLPFGKDIVQNISDFTSSRNPADTGTTRFTPRNAKKCIVTWKDRLTEEEIDRILSLTEVYANKFY